MSNATRPSVKRAPTMPSVMASVVALSLACFAPATAGEIAPPQVANPEDPPIGYSKATARDPVALLSERIRDGEARLEFDARHGYLPSALAALDVPRSSQGLVFSKTSLQRSDIGPRAPRAIYFNDDVYIGWVNGGRLIEIISFDPRLGGVFYTISQRRQDSIRPSRRGYDCLQCHLQARTNDVPGPVVRSHPTASDGSPIHFGAPSYTVDATTPFEHRWGGWYVTGTHGEARHLGNIWAADPEKPKEIDVERGANITDLGAFFDTSEYLTPHSDIVALMVLEHQTQAHNALARASYEAQALLARPEAPDDLDARLEALCDPVLERLLFKDEAPIASPIRGTSGFVEEFARRGPRDAKGRSLRDLDLERRLFRHPLSYLVHAKAVTGLPEPLHAALFRRLHAILAGTSGGERFAHLDEADRQAILEIVRETCERLPPVWTASGGGG